MEEIINFCLGHLDYFWVTILMAIESSFIPLPSEFVVPPAAWLACTPTGGMNIFLVVIFATLGADVGALVNYGLARHLGRPIIYKFADSRLGHLFMLSSEKLAHSEEYFRKHGNTSTFFGRLLPAVRHLISIPAGLSRMKLHLFILYTTLGAFLWNIVLAVFGWAFFVWRPDLQSKEAVAAEAAKYSHEIGYCLLALVALAIVYFVVKSKLKKRKQRTATTEEAPIADAE